MIEVASPLCGWVTSLEAVPDPVFADRMLGEGVAIDPTEGRLVAPASGTVTSVHPAGHAVTLTLDTGPVLLIHIGVDTVTLGGEGFSPKVQEGQRVEVGETLVLFDLDLLARRVRSLVTPVIVTNAESFRCEVTGKGPIGSGRPLLQLFPIARAPQGTHGSPIATRSVRLLLAHGLHARPAARLAKLASEFNATIDLVAEDGRAAPLRSPVTLLSLALRHGASVVLRASGPDAEPAVAALAELLESGMGELRPLEPQHKESQSRAMPNRLNGAVAVRGLAIGPAWRANLHAISVPEHSVDPDGERAMLQAARERLECALASEAQGDGAAASISEAHLAILSDPMLKEATDEWIASGKSAGFALHRAMAKFAEPLRASGDSRFAERLDDLIDLERRLLNELAGRALEPARPPAGAILIAETVYPSQLKELANGGIAGIATSAGGTTSHAAIIAAGLDLPMLVGLGTGLNSIEDGTPLVLRDDELIIASDPSVVEQARREAQGRKAQRASAQARAAELATTLDGTRIELFANLGSVSEAAEAVRQGAEGCGLLRTEFLFLDRDDPPDAAEQQRSYQAIADAFGERPLIVRTLDIGADKPAPWLKLDPEDNPALGLRGIRLQLARKDLLETQFRALLGVKAKGPLRIMLPMISTASELLEAKMLLQFLASRSQIDAPELGIMVETPAAALTSRALAKHAAFFSIGTNDLSQYALARDRTNPAVAAGLDALEPAILRLIDETVRGASAHGRPTGVCGSIACLPDAIPILVGLGITELSMPAALIAESKALVRALELDRCHKLAKEVMSASDATEVRSIVALMEQGR